MYKKALLLFEEFTNKFDLESKDLKQKYNHTLRTVEYAEKIALSLNLSMEEVNIVKVVTLFHDVGRFLQHQRFGGFYEEKSGDHAKLSVEGIKEESFFEELGIKDEVKNMLLDAILYHNKLKVSPFIDSKTKLYSQIIRDSEKIDILTIEALFMSKLDYGILSDDVFLKILKNNSIDYKETSSKLDIYMAKLAYVYDVNFDFTIVYFIEHNTIELILDKLEKYCPGEIYKLKQVREHLRNFMNIKAEEIQC